MKKTLSLLLLLSLVLSLASCGQKTTTDDPVAAATLAESYQSYLDTAEPSYAYDIALELTTNPEYFNAEQFDKALNGDGAGYAGFVKIASDYGSTDAGNLANLYAGLCYYYLGKAKEAVNYLEKYSPASDAMVSPAAVAALGNAYAAVGQLDKAVSKLKDAASKADSESKDGANNSLSPTFLLQAGELLESQNKTDEALKVYQDIKKKYVNSMLVQSNEIDKYIERTTK